MTRPALAVLVVLLAVAVAPPPAGAQQERPNIVFLFSDDHAAHALSAYREHLHYGARLPDTPNLDRLAAEGMLFTNAFVTNSICVPSRAAVLTGQFGHLTGVMTNQDPLHPDSETFPGCCALGGTAPPCSENGTCGRSPWVLIGTRSWWGRGLSTTPS